MSHEIISNVLRIFEKFFFPDTLSALHSILSRKKLTKSRNVVSSTAVNETVISAARRQLAAVTY